MEFQKGAGLPGLRMLMSLDEDGEFAGENVRKHPWTLANLAGDMLGTRKGLKGLVWDGMSTLTEWKNGVLGTLFNKAVGKNHPFHDRNTFQQVINLHWK